MMLYLLLSLFLSITACSNVHAMEHESKEDSFQSIFRTLSPENKINFYNIQNNSKLIDGGLTLGAIPLTGNTQSTWQYLRSFISSSNQQSLTPQPSDQKIKWFVGQWNTAYNQVVKTDNEDLQKAWRAWHQKIFSQNDVQEIKSTDITNHNISAITTNLKENISFVLEYPHKYGLEDFKNYFNNLSSEEKEDFYSALQQSTLLAYAQIIFPNIERVQFSTTLNELLKPTFKIADLSDDCRSKTLYVWNIAEEYMKKDNKTSRIDTWQFLSLYLTGFSNINNIANYDDCLARTIIKLIKAVECMIPHLEHHEKDSYYDIEIFTDL